MKKYIGLFIAVIMAFAFCVIGCDTEKGGSSSSGGGSGPVNVTGLDVDLTADVIWLTIGEHKTFGITYTPANANTAKDVTFDIAGDDGIIDCTIDIVNHKVTITALSVGEISVTAKLISNQDVKKQLTVMVVADQSDIPESADATTLEVIMDLSCDASVLDQIFMATFYYERGNYISKQASNSAINWRQIEVAKSNITLNKSEKNVKFDVVFKEDENFVTAGIPIFFQVKLSDNNDLTLFNLPQIKQEQSTFIKNYKYTSRVFSDGVYGDAMVDMQ